MFILFSAVVRLLSLLPARVLIWLLYPLSWLNWTISKTKRNSTLVNLLRCYPDMSERERQQLARDSMRHYILLALETGIAWYWSRERLYPHYDEAEGFADLQAAQDAGKGVVLMVPHTGNWELLQLWLNDRMPVMSLFKPGRYEAFEEKLHRKRCRFGGTMAPTSTAGIKKLFKFVRSGNLAIILPDQDPSEGQGHFIPFFDVQAYTPVLASRVARQTGCAVFMAVCLRKPGGRFQVRFLGVEDDFHDHDMEVSLAAMNRGVEACINLDPAQYLWAYKRFKTRPDGEPRFYRPYDEVLKEQ